MSDIPAAVRRTRRGIRLAEIDPRSTPGFDGDKAAGQAMLAERAVHLAELQERLHASATAGDERSVLLLLQGMDTAGKGGLVRHVVGSVDPQGVRITSFKRPTPAERRHDFLWRVERALPQPGQIGVFDRSHYEEVLIHRVRGLSRPEVVEARYGRIVEFEQQLAEQGIHLVKVMPHISYAEQGERLLERLDRPDKHWKYNPGDVDERMLWDEYQRAYAIAIDRTARAAAPWHVVPADRKWYARLAVQELLIEALEAIDPQWPTADYDVAAERERLVALGGIPEDALGAAAAAAADADGAAAADADGGGQPKGAKAKGAKAKGAKSKGSKSKDAKAKGAKGSKSKDVRAKGAKESKRAAATTGSGALMLELRPGCECCDVDLPPESIAFICTFECTWCEACAERMARECPNCGGELVRRPIRPAHLLVASPPSSTRILAPGCARPARARRRLVTTTRVVD